MTARPLQNTDLAVLIYIQRQLDEQERSLTWLAEKIDVPYNTVWRWFTRKQRALIMSDIMAMLRALKIRPEKAIPAIDELARTLDQADDER